MYSKKNLTSLFLETTWIIDRFLNSSKKTWVNMEFFCAESFLWKHFSTENIYFFSRIHMFMLGTVMNLEKKGLVSAAEHVNQRSKGQCHEIFDLSVTPGDSFFIVLCASRQ